MLRTEKGAFTQRSYYIYVGAFTQRRSYAKNLFREAAFKHTHFTHRSYYTQTSRCTERSFAHGSYFKHRRPYTQKLLHKEAIAHKSLQTAAFTEKLLQENALTQTHRSIYTEKPLD